MLVPKYGSKDPPKSSKLAERRCTCMLRSVDQAAGRVGAGRIDAKILFCCTLIHLNPYSLKGIKVYFSSNSLSISLKLYGLRCICVQLNKTKIKVQMAGVEQKEAEMERAVSSSSLARSSGSGARGCRRRAMRACVMISGGDKRRHSSASVVTRQRPQIHLLARPGPSSLR